MSVSRQPPSPDLTVSRPLPTTADRPTHSDDQLATGDFDHAAVPMADPSVQLEGTIAGYRLITKLGQGGMGAVYAAEDLALRRKVALKVMKPEVAGRDSSKQRFFREARAAARIEHDNIVPIYQVGEDNGVPYLAMQLLKGESLGQRLKKSSRLRADEVISLGRDIAAGLAAAHDEGLIHRDIKPDNIWIEPLPKQGGERAKILDFGLARPQEEAEELLTHTGTVLGTPAYMAPEQARGEVVDPRADLFSLGAVLYQMATGQRPFQGTNTLAVLNSLANDRPAAPITLVPDLPPALSKLIMRLLVKDRDKRIDDAHQVIEELDRLQKRDTVVVVHTSAPTSGPSPFADIDDEEPSLSRGSRTEVTVSRASKVPAKKFNPLWLVAGGLAALVLIACMVIFFQTKDGIVRVNISDAETDVSVNGKTVKGTGDHEVKLPPGEHSLKIKRGRLELETDRFDVKKGETTVVVIQFLKDTLFARKGDQVIGFKKVPGGGIAAVPKPKEKVPEPATIVPAVGPGGIIFDLKTDTGIPELTINRKGPLTLECCITVYDYEAKENQHVLGHTDMFGFYLSPESGGRISFDTVMPKNYVTLRAPGPIVPGKRHHIAGVRSGTTCRFYVDGKQVGVGEMSQPMLYNNPTGFYLGQFNGTLSEIRLSNIARYDGTDFVPPERFEPDNDTLGLYHCDEGQGTVLHDATSNGRNPTLNGEKWQKRAPKALTGVPK